MTRRETAMKRILTIVILFGVLSCGKQGPPRPPVPSKPSAASDLVVAQRGPTMVLTWSYPSLTTSGVSLDRVDRLLVYRFRESLPVELDPSATEINTARGAAVPPAIAQFDRVPTIPPERFRVVAEKVGELTREQIPSFTAGALVVVEDRPPLEDETGRPYRYTYGVASAKGREESDLSNLVPIVAIDVPVSPEPARVETTAGSVVLRWDPPARTVLGEEEPQIEGYNVYRLPSQGGSSLTAAPVNERPITATEYYDTPPYGPWRYAVTAVRHSGPPLHESQLPLLTPVEFLDRQAPPAPEDLSPLVEERVIRLIWTGVQAADLAGYRVYRQAAGRPHEELTTEPITRTSFIDEGAEPGIEYRYGVTSIDHNGNESAPVVTTPVLIPR